MATSIRTFLLINLLLCVTLITSLAIIGNLFLEHRNLQQHLDTQLAISAYVIQSFIEDEVIQQNEIADVQENIDQIPELLKAAAKTHKDHRHIKPLDERIQFQIWDESGKVFLHSPGAPDTPLSAEKPGYSDIKLSDVPWRVYTIYSKHSGMRVAVAERYEFRKDLEGRITEDSIFIMLITYPILGLLIWIVIGRGLDSIRKATREISHRAPGYLEPINIEQVPTEIKPFIDELNELFERLHEAFEREKRFAADAAHELRTPLAALRTHVQVALKADDESDRKAALAKVIAGVNRSTHVIQQLLTMSRMVPEATLEKSVRVNLSALASEIIADLVPAALQKNTEIDLDAPKSAMINGNATAIGILIRNLVDNAIRYTQESSTVHVVIESKRTKVTLNVIDNGPGIPEEARARVFERFYRVLGSTAPGSGLGLGIVQQIAALHKAKLSLDTAPSGQGLMVTVVFSK